MGLLKKCCSSQLKSICLGVEQTIYGLVLSEDDDNDGTYTVDIILNVYGYRTDQLDLKFNCSLSIEASAFIFLFLFVY